MKKLKGRKPVLDGMSLRILLIAMLSFDYIDPWLSDDSRIIILIRNIIYILIY